MISDPFRGKPHGLVVIDHRPKTRKPVAEIPIPGTFAADGVLYLRIHADSNLTFEQARLNAYGLNLTTFKVGTFDSEEVVEQVESEFHVRPSLSPDTESVVEYERFA